jgi:hypothetical protein
MNTPVSQDPMHPPVRYNPIYGLVIAVSSIHPQFHDESCRCRLADSKLRHGAMNVQDDDVGHRRRVVLDRNVHREDVHIVPANASTQGRSRRGGVRDKENERRWTSSSVYPTRWHRVRILAH